jgi:ribosomal protein L12E/L44/L45/RPP1/RPP2
MTVQKGVGATIAIAFVLLYSLIDDILVCLGCAKPAAAAKTAPAAKKATDEEEDSDDEAEHKPLMKAPPV